MLHYCLGIKDGHWSRWICVAAICLGLAPKAEAGEHSGLIALLARSFDIASLNTARPPPKHGREARAPTEAEIEVARLCIKATPMQTARITTSAQGRE